MKDGVRYHHILDPATGRPARGLRSATVLAARRRFSRTPSRPASSCMGPERGLALAEELDGVEAVLVDDAGELKVTSGLQDRLEILHPPTR